MSNEDNKYILIDKFKNDILGQSRHYFYKYPKTFLIFLILLGMVSFTIPMLLTINLIKLNLDHSLTFSILPIRFSLIIVTIYLFSIIFYKIYNLFTGSR
jgi:hypothetical protein